MSGYNESMDVYGTYDAIVSGGGLTGIACATALARTGRKVAIVERRSALGWEIGRARCATAGMEQPPCRSALVGELAKELDRWQKQDGGTRASVAELLFDRWAIEEHIDVMFHGWSSRVAVNGGNVTGLIVGTREGYRLLEAPLVVETDDSGRLIDADYSKTALQRRVYRAFHLRNANVNGVKEITLPDGRSLLLRAEAEHRARAEIELNETDSSSRSREFHTVISEAMRAIREQAEGCGQAAVYYWAEEEWGDPAFRLEDGYTANERPIGHLLAFDNGSIQVKGLSAGNMAVSKSEGLLFAGAWLPCYLAASPYDATAERPPIHVINRLLLGEAAASFLAAGSSGDYALDPGQHAGRDRQTV